MKDRLQEDLCLCLEQSVDVCAEHQVHNNSNLTSISSISWQFLAWERENSRAWNLQRMMELGVVVRACLSSQNLGGWGQPGLDWVQGHLNYILKSCPKKKRKMESGSDGRSRRLLEVKWSESHRERRGAGRRTLGHGSRGLGGSRIFQWDPREPSSLCKPLTSVIFNTNVQDPGKIQGGERWDGDGSFLLQTRMIKSWCN